MKSSSEAIAWILTVSTLIAIATLICIPIAFLIKDTPIKDYALLIGFIIGYTVVAIFLYPLLDFFEEKLYR